MRRQEFLPRHPWLKGHGSIEAAGDLNASGFPRTHGDRPFSTRSRRSSSEAGAAALFGSTARAPFCAGGFFVSPDRRKYRNRYDHLPKSVSIPTTDASRHRIVQSWRHVRHDYNLFSQSVKRRSLGKNRRTSGEKGWSVQPSVRASVRPAGLLFVFHRPGNGGRHS